MLFNFTKAVQFSLLIKTGGRLREFNFRKRKVGNEDVLSVDVCNERNDRIYFNMRKEENGWEIIPGNYPPWIEQDKKNIYKAVEEEMLRWQ